MKKVGIFGGTFDPIHFGHLITTQFVLEKRKLEKIIFIPSHISPHKLEIKTVADSHRFNMVQLAIENNPQFEISDYEINNSDISYTFNTLLHFKKTYNNIELIIGYDNLLVFDKWYKPDEIFEEVTVVAMNRNGNYSNNKNKFTEKAIIIDTPVVDISSTEIRERVKSNLPINYLTPPAVVDYIYAHKLYK